jgi:putative Holliday junction resolvase
VKRFVGLDVGERRIGVAVSDPLGMTAQPHEVVERRGARVDILALMEKLQGFEIAGFVAGLPLEMSGNEGSQVERVRTFCERLEKTTGIPVAYQDERLTSVQSERLLESAGVRRERRRGLLDKMAAALILQAWLDSRSSLSS